MRIFKKTSKITGLILASFLFVGLGQISWAQSVFSESSRDIEEYTTSGKTVGCGISVDAMNDEGLFVQFSTTMMISIEKLNLLYLYKVTVKKIDMDVLANEGVFKYQSVPVDFSWVQSSSFDEEVNEELIFDSRNWEPIETESPDEFMSGSSEDAGKILSVLLSEEVRFFLKKEDEYLDQEFIVPAIEDFDAVYQLSGKWLQCIERAEITIKNLE